MWMVGGAVGAAEQTDAFQGTMRIPAAILHKAAPK
jgi:hypothetical protein